MRAHQPGSTPIDIPETVPNPAYTPAPAPAPERAPTKVPEQVPEKVIAPESCVCFGSITDMAISSRDVRFAPNNGHYSGAQQRPLCANSGLMHRSKQRHSFDHFFYLGQQCR